MMNRNLIVRTAIAATLTFAATVLAQAPVVNVVPNTLICAPRKRVSCRLTRRSIRHSMRMRVS